MGTPLTPKYIPYTYMDPLGYELESKLLKGGNTRDKVRDYYRGY